VEAPAVLIVVPARADSEAELDPLLQTLAAVRATAPEAMVLLVDRSPAVHASMLELAAGELDCAYVAHADGESDTASLNVGLVAAAGHGMDACLFAGGLVPDPGWLPRLLARTGSDGEPAAVAGAPVIEPTGVIRQAGYFFSLFRRAWGARLGRVPEVLLDVSPPLLCPISSEVQLVRRDWIDRVGVYDEELAGPNAALDFCLRVSDEGGQAIFEPTVRARGLEQTDGEPDEAAPSSRRLKLKHAGVSFHRWSPEVV
jgi:hypothetical protein